MRTLLVTGGAGFIGSNFIQMLLSEYHDISIINVDSLSYAGNLANLKDIEADERYHFYKCDIQNKESLMDIFRGRSIDAVIHFAAESHVDRSIMDGRPFVLTNVLGTQTLLDCARESSVRRFVHVSTDEVYGSLGDEGVFTEASSIQPNSPYAASKAASDMMVRAYYETYGMDVVITRCSNNYGPFQFPEKLIPLMSTNAMAGLPLPIYGKGHNIRDWIHVSDHCRGVFAAYDRGKSGEVYNFGGECEHRNIDIVTSIIRIIGASESLLTYVDDRLGHDYRYAMGIEKARHELDWVPQLSFDDGLEETVEWYRSHTDWWESIKSGDYRHYYEEQYRNREVSL